MSALAQFPREEVAEAIWPDRSAIAPRIVRCRHCRQRNRVGVPAAVMEPARHTCGTCGQDLFYALDEPFLGLDPASYQHSLDLRSVSALAALPGLPRLARWLLEHVGDRTAHLTFMSNAIRCGEDQFPELVELTERARTRLDMQLHPTIFLGESPHMNALTTGLKEPVIVVRSALLDQMDDDELVAVLGHELGHLQAGHPLYTSVANMLFSSGANISPLVRFLSTPIQRALLRWSRCAELTADRAALLASRDIRACLGIMFTFAGGNRPGTADRTRMQLAPFLQQCRDLARLQGGRSVDRLLGSYLTMDRTHPHVAWRVMHLIQWIEHGNYLNILSGEYLRRPRPRFLPAPGGVRRRLQ